MKKLISLVIVLAMLVSGVIINTYATTITLNTKLNEISRKGSSGKNEQGEETVVDIPLYQASSVFNYVPANVEELKQVHRADPLLPNEVDAAVTSDKANGRFEVVALYFAALKAFDPKNPDVAYAMMEELCESPTTKILSLDSFNNFSRNSMKDNLSKAYKYKYVGNAYFNGAEPSNGYTPSEPLTVTLEDYVYSSQTSNQYQTQVYKITSRFKGADSERIIQVYQDSIDGKWYIYSDSWMGFTADMKEPALRYLYQWQNEPDSTVSPTESTTEPISTQSSTQPKTDDFLYKMNNNNAEITGYKGTDTKIEIPREINGCIVTSIAQQAFEGCTSIESVFIPDSVTNIGNNAFNMCDSLKRVIYNGYKSDLSIGSNNDSLIKTIQYTKENGFFNNGEWYFNYNDGSLRIKGNGNMEFGYNQTAPWSVYSSKIKSVVIESGITNIADNAFTSCINLNSIDISNTVVSIGECAFEGCAALLSLNISQKDIFIDEYAFYGCENIQTVKLGSNAFVGNGAFTDCTSLKNVYLSSSVNVIGDYAFSNCTSLESIKIPKCDSPLGQYAFSGCTNLSNIEIINGLPAIGNSAFYGCSSLTSISIPDSIESISKEAFVDCKNLVSVTIGTGCKSIASKAFWDCPNLKNITIKYPNCIFDDNQYTISSTAVICGYKNSTAYSYARTYKRSFEDIETGVNYGWEDGNYIDKKTNPIKVTVKAKTVKRKKLKKKAQKVKAITVKKAQGKVTYKLVKKGSTAKIFKLAKINSKGVITLSKWKKAKKGTYKLKVTITAAGNSNYNKKTVNKVVKIKIR